MDLAIMLTVTLVLVVSVVLVHYETLVYASRLALRPSVSPRRRILVIIGAAFLAHLVEIGLFAAGYALMELRPSLGTIGGQVEGGFIDHIYFSITMFTTLGVGDVAATGLLRLAAGVESLTGLVLITWTASFSYIAMEKLWTDP